MADIELVIKIPEKTVNEIKDNAMFAGSISSDIRWDITSAIVNSTPLPKGHGRLIDADEIQFENAEFDTYGDYCIAFDAIDEAEPIIEADKESEGD